MPLLSAVADPAADSAAPLPVLVLAWDEATPATRVLLTALDADPATARALLLVPHAAASASAAAVVHAASEPIRMPPGSATHAAVTASQPAPQQTSAADNAAELPDSATTPEPENTLVASVTETPPAGAYATVRVVRLSDFTLAELATRAGQPLPVVGGRGRATPAAPYLGSAETADSEVFSISKDSALLVVPQPTETAISAPKSRTSNLAVPPAPLVAKELGASVGPTAGADSATGVLAPTDAEALPSPAWAAALAALATPAPEAASASVTPATDPWPLALNFEIIQYARLAVPLALSEAPFSLIYAPSWPTWLAAQELSQRTSQPLVLHLTALAAGPAPADTAVGWAAELQRQVLRQADLVLVETYALARRLYRELGLATAAVRVVPAAEPAAIVRAWRGLVARRNADPDAAAASSDEATDLTDPLADPLADLPGSFELPADDHPATPTE